MSLLSLSGVAKLTITAFEDEDRTKKIDSFEAQYNPESLSVGLGSMLYTDSELASGNPKAVWRCNRLARLRVTLALDGTHVASIQPFNSPGKRFSVKDRVEAFIRCCGVIDSESHEIPFLMLTWSSEIVWSSAAGSSGFNCRLDTVDVRYTDFDRDGAPLHAELDATFVEEIGVRKQAKSTRLSSPDITHRRTVKSGDTLPLLCQEIYGETAPYLRVAEFNGLDDFRRLKPGSEILFPPYERSRHRKRGT